MNYPIPFAPSHFVTTKTQFQPQAHLGHLVLSSTWHHRLVHPSNNIVSLMLNKAHVQCTKISTPTTCQSCLQGKLCKFPFQQSVNKYVHPFKIVHSNLWGPIPCISIDGYRYYVTFVLHL